MSEPYSSHSSVELAEFRLQGSHYSRFLPESDCLPYYLFSRTNVAPLRCVMRKFEFTQGSGRLCVEVYPSRRIDSITGQHRPVYPGEREQLVATAIRAQAVRDSRSIGLAQNAEQRPAVTVTFSYRALRADLASSGHTLSHGQLVEAIAVLADTRIRLVRFSEGRSIAESLTFNVFSEHMSRGGRCVVTMNVFESAQILSGAYRPINYKRLMLFRSPVARWLYQYIRHEHRNAARHFGKEKVVPFVLDLDLLFSRGVIDRPKHLPRAIMRVRDALSELEQSGVLQSPHGAAGYSETRATSPTGGRRRVESARWTLWLSDRDAEEIILENSEAKFRRVEYLHLSAEERLQKSAAARQSLLQRIDGDSHLRTIRSCGLVVERDLGVVRGRVDPILGAVPDCHGTAE